MTTITFFRFVGWSAKWWAFKRMGLGMFSLNAAPKGLSMQKLMGSGAGNGFSIWPNWGVYAWLANWDSENDATSFFADHPDWRAFTEKSEESYTLYLTAFQAHGSWEGEQPFTLGEKPSSNQPIGVLTRATIRPKRLWQFWRYVPRVSRAVHRQDAMVFAIGIGELPLIQQATFSLWRNLEEMKHYAYQKQRHRDVVKKTRALDWYSEELFARFVPYHSEGSWEGKDVFSDLKQHVT